MKFKGTYSKLAGAIVMCLAIAPVLFAASTSSQPEVTLTVNADAMIDTMRGGFGASWHAIEQPIPVEGNERRPEHASWRVRKIQPGDRAGAYGYAWHAIHSHHTVGLDRACLKRPHPVLESE